MNGAGKLISFPAGTAALIAFIAMILIAVEGFAGKAVADHFAVAQDQACVVTRVEPHDGTATVGLDCGGASYEADNVQLALEYLKDPKPLRCTIFKSGTFDCKAA